MIGKLLVISLLSLFEAYFNGDMPTWQAAIDNAQWETLSNEDKAIILNTEYGFVASLIDEAPTGAKRDTKGKEERKAKAEKYLDTFVNHVEDAKSILPTSRYCTYRSAAYAFEFMINKKLAAGVKSFQFCKDAVEADPNDPFALALAANVDFYAPKILGGSKKKAIETFEQAREILLADPQYDLWWNKPATLFSLILCYKNIEDNETALQRAEEMLALYPNFTYLKDVFIPEISGE